VRCHLAEERFKQRADAQVTETQVIADKAGRPEVEGGKALLAVDDLKIHFPIHKGLFKGVVGHVKAVDGIDLSIAEGKTLALVGESGCGKTTVGKGILQLIRPTMGSVEFDEIDLTTLSNRQLRPRRGDFQIIFQDPFSSLNPRMRVTDIIEEGMVAQGKGGGATQRQQRIDQLLQQVGLTPEMKHRYPHEFSGGQRQRICIARALAVEPKLIICDEPTSALDVSVQAQILNLLKRLQQELGLAYLFITHDISVVSYLAHEVAVMYLGRIVERGDVEEVLSNPSHPYTQALLSSVPTIEEKTSKEKIQLSGEMPSPINPPQGCYFNPRCPKVMEQCRHAYPAQMTIRGSHNTHCFLYGEAKEVS
jgi:peptide/nickel transport system ATP-binding protein